MEKFKFIIIDDEHPTHLALKSHFKSYPDYECVQTFYDPQKAINFLSENKVDLIFLDIEMPEMNGFQFLEALKEKVFVVILTAYQEKYCQNAHQYYFDKDLIYFTNKAQLVYYMPKIIARFEKMYAEKEVMNRVMQLANNEINYFPKSYDNRAVPLKDIIMIMVIGHNIVLKMYNKQEIVFRMTFLQLKSVLPSALFVKIKRNLIINIGFVTAFTDSTVCIAGQHLTISHLYSKEIKEILTNYREKLRENY